MLEDADKKFLIRVFLICPAFVGLLYFFYVKGFLLASVMIIFIAIYIFNLIEALNTGKYRPEMAGAVGVTELDSREQPIRYGSSVILHIVGLIVQFFVLYLILS